MKVKTQFVYGDKLAIEISGENPHENAILDLIGARQFVSHYVSQSAGTAEPTTSHLSLSFEASLKAAKAEKSE